MNARLRRPAAHGIGLGRGLGLGLLVLSALAAAPARAGGLPVVDYRLENGLRVILHRDRRFPVVQVHVRYHVGARHEQAGRTGLAHLFEHLLFDGSPNLKDPFEYLHRVGAVGMNGSTEYDHTDYYQQMPRANLAVALWAESDRMGFLPDALAGGSDPLDQERKIVMNERRLRVETVPYRSAEEALWHALFPPSHPYHGFVIGSMDDLAAATPADCRAFFKRYYAPSNATLVLAGDIDVAEAQALVQRYFGSLPAVPAATAPIVASPALGRAVVLRHDERVGTERRLSLAWHSPAAFEPGDRAAVLLARILGAAGGRLRRQLEGQGLAYLVSAEQQSLQAQSVFHVRVQLAPGAAEARVLAAVDEVLEEVRLRGVSDEELRAARARTSTVLLTQLDALSGKAALLHDYADGLGAPDRLTEDLAAYEEVQPQEIQRLARAVLRPDRRAVLWAAPGAAPEVDR